ncbi:TonB-dependent receptor [Sphingomonas sp. BK580]|uniref:TonB-dependent receptor n=1 Tax=Sphingomonas sp. BK580 TaxID=2586972 RepID=UPI00161C8E39|nr:TonB-dependent receptor [Sphingomonas sp. BK580]MBB3694542.1 hypothetical protein [Sphingomonas sp. BK580]
MGALAGTVQRADGRRANGGVVKLRSDAQGFERAATVSRDGSFRAAALPIGRYQVTIDVPGAPTLSDTITISAGAVNAYTFTVGAAAADSAAVADVVVTGRARRVNDLGPGTGGVAIGDVGGLLDRSPIARDQTALTLLAPGTTAGDTTFGSLASLSGATVAENAYYVNGLNVTNFRTFLGGNTPPIEFYQSFAVQTYGLPAEFGRVLGGTVTAVTKSGSNRFKAGALVSYAPAALRATSPDSYASLNRRYEKTGAEANYYVSGPLIRDHLFFYALYNPNRHAESSFDLLSEQQRRYRSHSPFYGAKIDAVLGAGQRVEGTFFRDRQVDRYLYRAIDPVSRDVGERIGAVTDRSGGNNFVVTYNGQFAPSLSLTLSYGENHDDRGHRADPEVAIVTSTLGGDTQTVRGFDYDRSVGSDTRRFYRADADAHLRLAGTHHVRAGFERESLTSASDTSLNGGYYFTLTPNYIRRSFSHNAGVWHARNESFYLQDSWSLLGDRLTLQPGLRDDRFSNDAIDGATFFRSGEQWGPRLGAALDVFGDHRTSLFGSWNRYFLPVSTDIDIHLGGAGLQYRQDFAYPDGVDPHVVDAAGIPVGLRFDQRGNVVGLGRATRGHACPAVSPNAGELCSGIYRDGVKVPTDGLISSTLQPSYADEWDLGVEQRLGAWRFRAAYINRRLGRALDDMAVDAAAIAYCRDHGIAGCADVFTGFHQYVLANPGSDVTVRLNGRCDVYPRQCGVARLSAAALQLPRAKRDYDSVQLEVQRGYADRWSLQASYTYTRLRGNYEGSVKSDNGQRNAGETQDFDQPGLLDGAYGILPNERAHTVKMLGSYGIGARVRVGANVLVESPRHFSCLGAYFDSANFAAAYDNGSYYCAQPRFVHRRAFADPASGRVTYLVPRGTAFASDWRRELDVNAQLDLPRLPGSFLSIDVFNLLGSAARTDYQEYGENRDGSLNRHYGLPLEYQPPRSVRLTLGVRLGERGEG